MSKLNIQTAVTIYSDPSSTNNPSQQNVNWANNIQGIEVQEPESKSIKVYPSQTEVLFSGVVETDVDNTTEFDLFINPEISNTYVLGYANGTAPAFRQSRAIGIDATTEVSIAKSGDLVTLAHSSGTALNTANIIEGDILRLGDGFQANNQGTFVIIQKTIDSIIYVNSTAIAETVVLGANFDEFMVYSSNGVQVGHKVKITEGFSVYSRGTYDILEVAPNYLVIASSKAIPEEFGVLSKVEIFTSSKSFIYVECDKECTIYCNNVDNGVIKPLKFGINTTNSIRNKPGVYLKTGDIYSATVTNNSTEIATVLVISAE